MAKKKTRNQQITNLLLNYINCKNKLKIQKENTNKKSKNQLKNLMKLSCVYKF